MFKNEITQILQEILWRRKYSYRMKMSSNWVILSYLHYIQVYYKNYIEFTLYLQLPNASCLLMNDASINCWKWVEIQYHPLKNIRSEIQSEGSCHWSYSQEVKELQKKVYSESSYSASLIWSCCSSLLSSCSISLFWKIHFLPICFLAVTYHLIFF